MPGKRARRHFSQLSEFERVLIIGMKTAGWSTRRVAGQVDRSACAVRNCWEQWTREGTHVENRVWSDQEDHEERGSKDRAASTCGPHSDSFNDTSRRPFLNGPPRAIFQQENARPHTARLPTSFSDSSMASLLPLPVEHVWDQLKRQMPSCHSEHDLELAVQDLWAHLPQDNIRCLINSMPDRVAACIAAGGGPTCY
ncbi:uncharacterized protein TNCV_164111 [Trichonephila clavipes]|nr:uncharacterized protein TNCV_164111 [Trichonephila clavipes]